MVYLSDELAKALHLDADYADDSVIPAALARIAGLRPLPMNVSPATLNLLKSLAWELESALTAPGLVWPPERVERAIRLCVPNHWEELSDGDVIRCLFDLGFGQEHVPGSDLIGVTQFLRRLLKQKVGNIGIAVLKSWARQGLIQVANQAF